MVTEEEIIASFNPAEEVVVENNTIPEVSTKDAVNAFEIAFNFLQRDLEIDYKEFKTFKSFKEK